MTLVPQGSQHPQEDFSAIEPERQPAGNVISAARTAALADLHEAVRSAIRARQEVPCVADPEGGWTSDEKRAREHAAWRCLDCPAFLACEQYRFAFPESGGVWAGVGYSPTRAIDYLQRPEPDRESYETTNPHVSIVV